MTFHKIAVLTSKESWFVPYARKFVNVLITKGYKAKLFFSHKDIKKNYELIFILSYFKIIPEEFLANHNHNLVVHESQLPRGKGWAPLFWQILEGKNKIPIVLFEAAAEIDKGDIYLEDYLYFDGHELHDEIREKQAAKTLELCFRFLTNYDRLVPIKQRGKSTHYRKRVPSDSEIDINRSIKGQFNLLRIVNNKEFPAFFRFNKHKYRLEIYKIDNDY